jgi:hypothetical protein
MFKYSSQQVDIAELKKYCIKHVIDCEKHDQYILLDTCINNEGGGGMG